MTKSATWSRLTPRARSVFMFLWGTAQGVNETDDGLVLHCRAKRATIRKAEGCSIATVQRTLDKLREAKLIETHSTRGRFLSFTLFIPAELLADDTAQGVHPEVIAAVEKPIERAPADAAPMRRLPDHPCAQRSITSAPSTEQDRLAHDPLKHDHNNSTPQSRGDVGGVVIASLELFGFGRKAAEKLAAMPNASDPLFVEFAIDQAKERPEEYRTGFVYRAIEGKGNVELSVQEFEQFRAKRNREREREQAARAVIDQAADDELWEACRHWMTATSENAPTNGAEVRARIGKLSVRTLSSLADDIQRVQKRRAQQHALEQARQDREQREQPGRLQQIREQQAAAVGRSGGVQDGKAYIAREQRPPAATNTPSDQATKEQAERIAAEKAAARAEQDRIGRNATAIWQALNHVRDDESNHHQHNYVDGFALLSRAWPRVLMGTNGIEFGSIARERVIDDDTLHASDPWELFELLVQAAQKKLGTTTHEQAGPARVEQADLFSTVGASR